MLLSHLRGRSCLAACASGRLLLDLALELVLLEEPELLELALERLLLKLPLEGLTLFEGLGLPGLEAPCPLLLLLDVPWRGESRRLVPCILVLSPLRLLLELEPVSALLEELELFELARLLLPELELFELVLLEGLELLELALLLWLLFAASLSAAFLCFA